MSAATDGPRVRLADIATEAGVSVATISKVLNGHADISPATRSRVDALLTARGYTRRAAGEKPRGDLIELVFHEFEASWSMEIIAGVEEVAKAHGLAVVVTESGGVHSLGEDWLEGALRRRPAGIVLVSSALGERQRLRLATRGIPLVIVDSAGDPPADIPSVGSANWSGGLAATRHLIELGHRRIAAITGPGDMLCSLARLDGYRTAMASAGLDVDPRWVRFGTFYVEGGRDAARDLLELEDRPTAIFAGNDLQALGVYDAARELGLRLPDELSVVGYDDIAPARWVSPALTTVHQPLRRMGAEATRMVLDTGVRSSAGVVPRMDLATHLVVRGSTASPR
ncbi:LacI family transcriptional regulator [Microbacterium enclense]|uniref:LacI family transcriptional regulator n=1 Tax=Microbacterium enclense TaxID=993073 RepID=A0A3S3P6E5_9MICO|nr:LacI family DNA-binding transcriptional regulator [Microbacterium enclense]RWR20933.1 LacI family transcriptional regulator [Microbacterium enclense]